MQHSIPTYSITSLPGRDKANPDIYFAEDLKDRDGIFFTRPYRSNYYGIGLCTSGNATLNVNLETYQVKEGSLIAMSPQLIKQWGYCSPDYKIPAAFFTRQFLLNNGADAGFLNNFPFFELHAAHVTALNGQEAGIILHWLEKIKETIQSTHPHAVDIVKNLVRILLFETSSVYNRQGFSSFYKQTRSEQITHEFKKLVSAHFKKERSVKFYAGLLFITPKHLTETVREVTGKPAGEWIDETVILEAKILLQEPAASIAHIADTLHFPDQSAFGRYFKKATGLSPLAYKQSR
jgi:AraC family transcriptional regulator, transcriptional activator of pobA